MATFNELISRLDVLEISNIRNWHKIPDIGGVLRITDMAVQLHLNYVGDDIWLPLSILRVSTHGDSIWIASWKYRQLYGE